MNGLAIWAAVQVSFVMPSKYTLDTLPKPKDSDVKLEEVPSQTFGVISWR